MNKKKSKKGLLIARVPRGCDVARKATWQSHAGPRSAYMAYTYIFIYYHKYNGFSAFLIGEGYSTHIIVGPYKPDDLFYPFPCGTNPHDVLNTQVTWLDEERRIKWMIDRHASIEWTRGPRIKITHVRSTAWNLMRRSSGRTVHRINQGARGLNPCVTTATIKSRRGASRSSNQDPTGAIQAFS